MSTIEGISAVAQDLSYSIRTCLETVNSPNSSLSHDLISRPFRVTSNLILRVCLFSIEKLVESRLINKVGL